MNVNNHSLKRILQFSILFLIISILVFSFGTDNALSQSTNPPTIKITSHTTNQQVPAGPLTISGISSDTPSSNCLVSVIWNDLRPYHNAKATGPEGSGDFSTWSFTFDSSYHLIDLGENKLTSKISCFSPVGEKWYSINVTGVDSGTTGIENNNASEVLDEEPVQVDDETTTSVGETLDATNASGTDNETLPNNIDLVYELDSDEVGPGDEQTITITSINKDTEEEIPGIKVDGRIIYLSGLTTFFSGITDEDGEFSYSWEIDPELKTPGIVLMELTTITAGNEEPILKTLTFNLEGDEEDD